MLLFVDYTILHVEGKFSPEVQGKLQDSALACNGGLIATWGKVSMIFFWRMLNFDWDGGKCKYRNRIDLAPISVPNDQGNNP